MFSFAKLQFSACIMLYLNQYHQYGKEDWKSVSQEAASLWVSVSSTSSALFTVCASFNIYALSSWRHSRCASQQERSFFFSQASKWRFYFLCVSFAHRSLCRLHYGIIKSKIHTAERFSTSMLLRKNLRNMHSWRRSMYRKHWNTSILTEEAFCQH